MANYEHQSDQDEMIDIKGAISYFFRNIWIIILWALLFGCITSGIARLAIPKKYESYVLFNTGNSALIESYSVIVSSAPVLEEVAHLAGIDYEYEQLSSMISASSVGNTDILRVTVEDTDPQKAQHIANTIADVLSGRIAQLYPGNGISVVQSARRPAVSSYPNHKRIFFLACCIGALLSFAGLTIYYFIRNNIRSVDHLKQSYSSIPLLTVIPGDNKTILSLSGQRLKRGNKNIFTASGNTMQAFKFICTEIKFLLPKAEKCHVVGITGTSRDEEKEIVSINTAYILASSTGRTLLIDGDMCSSVIADQLGLSPSPGLYDMLSDNVPSDRVMKQYKINTGGDKPVFIDVLMRGSAPPDTNELLNMEKLDKLIDSLRNKYDNIIIDLPPAAEDADAQVLSRLLDGIVVVVRKDVTSKTALAETLRRLKLVNGNIIGFVYNEGQNRR